MELVAAGLHGDVHDGAAGLAEFRRVVAGLNGPFLNGIHARLVLLIGALAEDVGAIHAVNQNFFRSGNSAVDAHSGPGEGRAGLVIRAGQQRDQVERIPNAGRTGTDGEAGGCPWSLVAMVLLNSPLSVFEQRCLACTVTESEALPTSSVASTRMVCAAWIVRPVRMNFLNRAR